MKQNKVAQYMHGNTFILGNNYKEGFSPSFSVGLEIPRSLKYFF